MARLVDRRDVLLATGAVAAAGLWPGSAALASAGVLETTAVRLTTDAGICIAPLYLAGELLLRDGFADVQLVPTMKGPSWSAGARPTSPPLLPLRSSCRSMTGNR